MSFHSNVDWQVGERSAGGEQHIKQKLRIKHNKYNMFNYKLF